MKFILNGKDYGDQDLDLLIHYDSVTELTELQFNGNDGEHILDSDSCDISIDIDISSEDDIGAVFEDTLDLKSSAFTAEHAANIIKRELKNIQEQYDKLYEQYIGLCESIVRGQEDCNYPTKKGRWLSMDNILEAFGKTGADFEVK